LVTFVLCLTVAKVDSIGFVTGMKVRVPPVPPAAPLSGGWVAGNRCERPATPYSVGAEACRCNCRRGAMIAVIVGWSIAGAWRMMTRDA
jgi:hypothetical protein